MTQSYILTASHLSKTIQSGDKKLTILKNIDLNVVLGESLAIIGASGSGKTTLLSLLAGLDTPDDGEIILLGEDLTKLNEDERATIRAKQVGFIFQNFQLMPGLTALENVMLPLELQSQKNAKQTASQWLAHVGLKDRLTHYPSQLSGGEQQRVAIARAFSIRPKLLFADEPTGNLDKQSAINIIQLLFTLNREVQTTIIVATHDELLAHQCQRQLTLDDGRLQ